MIRDEDSSQQVRGRHAGEEDDMAKTAVRHTSTRRSDSRVVETGSVEVRSVEVDDSKLGRE